ncbi:Uncharacterised protein [Serratia quinivorans]|uniref:hypothetical protein n=1 Tax=Serratia quinivorans TaxID=137545 RepID=UPI00217BE94F|nr:hypothetical protein [Serratia quinivorans]CAI1614324.1 Uncharacterised protein [Serratia quinivorans]
MTDAQLSKKSRWPLNIAGFIVCLVVSAFVIRFTPIGSLLWALADGIYDALHPLGWFQGVNEGNPALFPVGLCANVVIATLLFLVTKRIISAVRK